MTTSRLHVVTTDGNVPFMPNESVNITSDVSLTNSTTETTIISLLGAGFTGGSTPRTNSMTWGFHISGKSQNSNASPVTLTIAIRNSAKTVTVASVVFSWTATANAADKKFWVKGNWTQRSSTSAEGFMESYHEGLATQLVPTVNSASGAGTTGQIITATWNEASASDILTIKQAMIWLVRP